jgi:monofunctional glycosyltransferase
MSYFGFNDAPPPPRSSLLGRIVMAIVILLLLPYLITPFYLFVTPPSTPMLWRYATGQRVTRIVMPLDAISPTVPAAVIASEDQRFCTHHGIDWSELRQAIEDAEDVDDLRGGSTITQQTVKNLFLWPGRSFVRKALEFPLALWVDFVLPKRRIMELYLNIAEWGPNGEFGVEAGSRRAFNRSAQDLNYAEAALLAAVLPNPVTRNARQPGPAVRRLAAIYERRALGAGALIGCLRRSRSP